MLQNKRKLINDPIYGFITIPSELVFEIIEHIDFPWDIKSVVYQHHERMDGSGYPNGLKGKAITIPARIVAIADVYEAMSTDRPYRSPFAPLIDIFIFTMININVGHVRR